MAIVVLIPALKPSDDLLKVIDPLVASEKVSQVIVVNDGSPPEFDRVFEQADAKPKTIVLRHAVNLGKGVALRTGLNYFLCNADPHDVIVTADADGQHLPADILAVGEKAESAPEKLVLGSRAFSGDVPLRSRFGNDLTRRVFRFLIGPKVSDTQTGLRAIPRALMPRLLRSKSNGYEFELQMLIMAAEEKINITPIPIETVYIEENKSSHFNPVMDSMRIYFVFIRFMSSSLIASLVDFIIFTLVFGTSERLGLSIAIARIFSGTLNFALNKGFVFKSKARLVWSILKFAGQEALLATLSYLSIRALVRYADWSPFITKPLVEAVLFVCSFAVQRVLVFDRSTEDDE